MRRVIVVFCWLVFVAFPIVGQDKDPVRLIANILSYDVEDLPEEELERMLEVFRRPIGINTESPDRLMSYGIFTQFQIASLMDYRNSSGPCMSFMELSALNGFGEEFVSRLRPIISLDYHPETCGRTTTEITARGSARYSQEILRYGYNSRCKLKVGDACSASLALSKSLDTGQPLPDAICGSLQSRFRKIPLSLVIGDFNARYGQGLGLWTGSSFSSLNTPSSFMKRRFGVTPSSSFTGTGVLTGVAAEYNTGKYSVSAFTAMPGIKSIRKKPEGVSILPCCNVSYYWKNAQAGVTHQMELAGLSSQQYIPVMKTSCDVSMCLRGIDVFSEIAFDWVRIGLDAVAGVVWPVGQGGNMAAMIKTVQKDYSMAVSGSLKKRRLSGSMSGDLVLYAEPKVETQDRSLQLKLHTQWQYDFSDSWYLTLRFTERIRSWGQLFRTDVRADLGWQSGIFSAIWRLNALQCDGVAWLTYLDGGLKTGKWALHLRQGVFFVDDWDDRIYAYERDVPGAYNVPAFYGRGIWTSFFTSWKPAPWCTLYLRTALTSYPFMQEKKPGKAELRFQSVFDF